MSLARRARSRRGKLRIPRTLTELYPAKQLLRLVVLIRSGVWPYVAAQSVGISRNTYYRWMEYGENGTAPFVDFYNMVTREAAAARGGAESAVYQELPHMWLRFG